MRFDPSIMEGDSGSSGQAADDVDGWVSWTGRNSLAKYQADL
jgi:hypothetical protein